MRHSWFITVKNCWLSRNKLFAMVLSFWIHCLKGNIKRCLLRSFSSFLQICLLYMMGTYIKYHRAHAWRRIYLLYWFQIWDCCQCKHMPLNIINRPINSTHAYRNLSYHLTDVPWSTFDFVMIKTFPWETVMIRSNDRLINPWHLYV